ncbi:MAG: HU family DNA-binding protein [Clostridia bacterium]|jgi:DNA-binding protein HU-beta|nr:HU family DNA-binding protein [Clostridia bacterium]MBO7296226.1 HU family DNA-binding protein [Clostridia bacterium]
MNKTQLIQKIAENGNMTKKDAEVALNAVVAAISDAVAAGEKVQLSGFGSFDVKARDARTGRNPKTGEAVEIAASKRVVFAAAQALKDKIN